MRGGKKGNHLSTGRRTAEDAGEDGRIGGTVSGRGRNYNAGGRICGYADGLSDMLRAVIRMLDGAKYLWEGDSKKEQE